MGSLCEVKSEGLLGDMVITGNFFYFIFFYFIFIFFFFWGGGGERAWRGEAGRRRESFECR